MYTTCKRGQRKRCPPSEGVMIDFFFLFFKNKVYKQTGMMYPVFTLPWVGSENQEEENVAPHRGVYGFFKTMGVGVVEPKRK